LSSNSPVEAGKRTTRKPIFCTCISSAWPWVSMWEWLGVGAIWLQEAREREEAEARARESAYQAEMEQRAKCLWRGEAGAHAGQRRCHTSFMVVSVTSLAEGGDGDVPRVVGFRGLLLTGVSLHRSQWIRCTPPSRTSTPATTRTPPAKSVPRTRSPHD